MKNKIIFLICYMHVFTLPLFAQLAVDTLLFTIDLINEPSVQSLFNLNNAVTVKAALSGPVVMKDDNLLFFSENGYLLFNQQGSIIDSHSVFKKNSDLAKGDPGRIKLAFPINNNSLLFYSKVPNNGYALTIYEKKTYRRIMNPLKEKDYAYCKEIQNKHIYNIVFSAMTDDMQDSYCVVPRLVGFSSLDAGEKWWSVDKLYSFSSPVVNELDGTYKSLFPGGVSSKREQNRIASIQPLQLFTRDNRWFYTGVHSGVSSKKEKCFQTYFVFDQAGNELYADSLFKRDNVDAVIGEDDEFYYTMKKVKRDVFRPAVSSTGDVFYAIIDYKKKRIEVRKRIYYVYKSETSEPRLAKRIDDEKYIEVMPVDLSCNMKSANYPVIPEITLYDSETKKFTRAQKSHLTVGGYICYISRIPNRDIKKRLARGRSGLPKKVKGIVGLLLNNPTVLCPYSITIKSPKGVVRTFNYPPDDEIVCARILALRNTSELVIRVDCLNYAEVLIIKTDGTFVNRFIFNRQRFNERLDIVVSDENSPITELDYETVPENHTYLQWVRSHTH